VGDVACVDILEKGPVQHGLEDDMKTNINKMSQEFPI